MTVCDCLSVFSWFPFVGAFLRSFSGHFSTCFFEFSTEDVTFHDRQIGDRLGAGVREERDESHCPGRFSFLPHSHRFQVDIELPIIFVACFDLV